MEHPDIEHQLRELDRDLADRDYLQARVRLFSLLNFLQLPEQGMGDSFLEDHISQNRSHHAPIFRRLPRLYRVLVEHMEEEFKTVRRRARRELDVLAIRRVIQNQEAVTERVLFNIEVVTERVMFNRESGDGLLSIRELARLVQDEASGAAVREACRIVEGYRAQLQKWKRAEPEARYRERRAEIAALEKKAAERDMLERDVGHLEADLERSGREEAKLRQQIKDLYQQRRSYQERLAQEEGRRYEVLDEAEKEREKRRHIQAQLYSSEKKKRESEAELQAERQRGRREMERAKEFRDLQEIRISELLAELKKSEAEIAELSARVSQRDRAQQDQHQTIIQIAANEDARLEQGEENVPTHERYGYLIARVWELVQQRTGFLYHDLEVFAEELDRVLKNGALVEELLSGGKQEAVAAFNTFQDNGYPWVWDALSVAGLEHVDRTQMILAFGANWQQWQRKHRRLQEEGFLQFVSGSLAAQKSVEALLTDKGIQAEMLTKESFCQLWDTYPEWFEARSGRASLWLTE